MWSGTALSVLLALTFVLSAWGQRPGAQPELHRGPPSGWIEAGGKADVPDLVEDVGEEGDAATEDDLEGDALLLAAAAFLPMTRARHRFPREVSARPAQANPDRFERPPRARRRDRIRSSLFAGEGQRVEPETPGAALA